MTFLLACALAPIAGCQALPLTPDPTPDAPTLEAPPASAPSVEGRAEDRAGASPEEGAEITAGQYLLDFEVAIESSCSQSWDLTTHTGSATLTIAPDRSARLEMRVVNHSIGPGYNSWHWAGEADPVVCVWLGAIEADLLHLKAQGEPSKDHYTCRIMDDDVALEGFSARCRPSAEASVVCEGEPRLPWLMALMARQRPLIMGPAGGPVARYRDGDGLIIQGELITPEGAQPKGSP